MVTIKGLRDGLLVIFGEQPWITQLHELEAKLEANANFFRGGRIALDVRNIILTKDDIKRVNALLTQYEVTLWALLAQQAVTARNADALGYATTIADRPRQARETATSDIEESAITSTDGTDGLLVRRLVRSGQVLRHPGHIVVIGDVNPGAQLIAGGDIIVWGKLQGLAHAGALGDSNAVICALSFLPGIVKIADATRSQAPANQRRVQPKNPEMAVLEEQEIRIVPWNEK